MAQQTHSRLLGLPRELRDLIYEHLFAAVVYLDGRKLPGILVTCKQLRDEALVPFFKLAHFRFNNVGSIMRPKRIHQMLARMPSEHLALITHLRYRPYSNHSTRRYIRDTPSSRRVAGEVRALRWVEDKLEEVGVQLRPGVLKIEYFDNQW
ncbi:hypothetical protein LTR85_009788 [Meristemomyces frigidus]|nr:hypothetical protein LTR85_009788 [Meristemomyces frigidus]